MMSDQEVYELYRCLLGRAPETPDTVAAFKAYYGTFARGRDAILQSAEFAGLYATIAGDACTRVAQGLLARAGGPPPPQATTPNALLLGAMRLMLRAHGRVHLAVIVGDTGIDPLDVLPIETGTTAVLHVAPHFPGTVPQTAPHPGGGTLFRTAFDPPALASFLRGIGVRIDVLALLSTPAPWTTALQGLMADRAIVIGVPGTVSATAHWPRAERKLDIAGLEARHLGGWFLPVAYIPPPVTAAPAGDAPVLWLATIVRNEEAAVANMLRSVAPAVTGFVVVDTGSTDATIANAEACLKDICKPYLLDSCTSERFDDMRNAALDLVPPDAAWVLMLDADEELCAEDCTALLDFLRTADKDAYALPRYNYQGADKSGEVTPYPDRQVRLLRHGAIPPVRYSGAVHETIRGVEVGVLPLDATCLGQGAGGPHIHHLVRRFRSPEAEAAKQARYRAIAAVHGA
jgi:hypothetical protein